MARHGAGQRGQRLIERLHLVAEARIPEQPRRDVGHAMIAQQRIDDADRKALGQDPGLAGVEHFIAEPEQAVAQPRVAQHALDGLAERRVVDGIAGDDVDRARPVGLDELPEGALEPGLEDLAGLVVQHVAQHRIRGPEQSVERHLGAGIVPGRGHRIGQDRAQDRPVFPVERIGADHPLQGLADLSLDRLGALQQLLLRGVGGRRPQRGESRLEQQRVGGGRHLGQVFLVEFDADDPAGLDPRHAMTDRALVMPHDEDRHRPGRRQAQALGRRLIVAYAADRVAPRHDRPAGRDESGHDDERNHEARQLAPAAIAGSPRGDRDANRPAGDGAQRPQPRRAAVATPLIQRPRFSLYGVVSQGSFDASTDSWQRLRQLFTVASPGLPYDRTARIPARYTVFLGGETGTLAKFWYAFL